MKLNHPFIARCRERGDSWVTIAGAIGYEGEPDSLRRSHARWRQRNPSYDPVADAIIRAARGETKCTCEDIGGTCDTCQPLAPVPGALGARETREVESRTLTATEVSRIRSLDELLEFFDVDTEQWTVLTYKVNSWESQQKAPDGSVRIVPLYQVKATLVRSFEAEADELRRVHEQLLEDLAAHAPRYELPAYRDLPVTDEPHLLEIAIHDPHIGMLAWGREVGQPYDSDIAVADYGAAVEHLLGVSSFYPIERILYIVGHDLLHVDAPGVNARGGTTAAGTPQDVDSRLARMFTYARRAVVAGIDRARLIAPVDVVVVPGNHDRESMYKLGEVLYAWYRNDDAVNVIYGPNKRKFYGYGRNAFMLTHGEEYRRKRDNLPMIFATECPAELWVQSEGGCREVHTGHNHVMLRGGYYPTAEVDESRGIRTRSLPALTPPDSWHYEQGYKHQRAATALVYRKSGGVAGEHQFTL